MKEKLMMTLFLPLLSPLSGTTGLTASKVKKNYEFKSVRTYKLQPETAKAITRPTARNLVRAKVFTCS